MAQGKCFGLLKDWRIRQETSPIEWDIGKEPIKKLRMNDKKVMIYCLFPLLHHKSVTGGQGTKCEQDNGNANET